MSLIISFPQRDDSTTPAVFEKPTEDDFEYIKLISNGAYGWGDKIVFSYLKVLGRDTQWFINFDEYLSGRPESEICIESWTKADLLFGVLSPWTLVTWKKNYKTFCF